MGMRLPLAALALALVACGDDARPPAVRVTGTRELGVVRDPSISGLLRDGGPSARIGDRMVWTFGDTLFPFPAVDGAQLRSATAGWADPTAPLVVAEAVDATGAPYQLLPFTADEVAASPAPDERVALWPAAVVERGGAALILYTRLKVHPGELNYETLSTGFAELAPGATVARRLGEVFVVPEAQLATWGFAKDGTYYAYGCEPQGGCRLGRAPLPSVESRAAWSFWDGNAWTADLRGAPLDVPGSTTGFSVTWNDAFGAFVAVESVPFSGRIRLRTAPAPEGPFSAAVDVMNVGAPIYATVQHPELATASTIAITYYRSTGSFQGDLHLVEVSLARR